MKIHVIFLSFVLLLLTVSCENDANLKNPSLPPTTIFLDIAGATVTVENGLAHILSIEEAKTIAFALDGDDGRAIASAIAQLPGFISAEEKYQSLTEEMFISPEEIPTEFDRIAKFTKIGADIYLDQVTNDPLFSIFSQ